MNSLSQIIAAVLTCGCNESMLLVSPFRSALAFSSDPSLLYTLLVRTPATQAYAKDYRQRLMTTSGASAVELGGWNALERQAVDELASRNFAALKPHLPKALNIPAAGGWTTVQALAADPKGALLNFVKSSLKGQDQSSDGISASHIDAIAALLQAQGKGFESDLVDGEWVLLFQKQAQKSPRFQKLVGRREKAGKTQSNFDVAVQQFYGKVPLLRWGLLSSTVQYRPLAENFEVFDNGKKSVILRRVACDIVGASWKFWKLPRLPLPLRVKGGYLDFVYLDKDLRVTRGNRGGLFIHARPVLLQQLMQDP